MMRRSVAILALALLALCAVMPLCSESSDGVLGNDVSIYGGDDVDVDAGGLVGTIEIDAGGSAVIRIKVHNNGDEDTAAKVKEYLRSSSDISVDVLDDIVNVEQGKVEYLRVSISPDRYAHAQQSTVTFIVYLDGATGSTTETLTLNVIVSSPFASGDQFNRIFGVWASPFVEPIYAVLITLLIWAIIAFVISYLIIPAIMFRFIKEDRAHKKEMRRSVWKPFFLLIMLSSLSLSARIYGIGEETTAILDNIVEIAYILVGAMIVWQIYRAAVAFMINRIAEKNKEGAIDNTLIPLMEMIGKIIIATAAVASILAALGFDLVMILTGAGLVGLAISLGAQNTLSQFFSGLVLLATRPFIKGDFVRIDGGDVLKVRRVGIMSTEFDDWSGNNLWIMPNNMVATSAITNITGKTRVYKVNVFVGIPKDANVDLAKELMLEAAMEHPRVVKNGSFDMPFVRLDSFEETHIKMRLSVFVDDFDSSGTIGGQLRESIVKKFRENDLEIEFSTDIVIHRDE